MWGTGQAWEPAHCIGLGLHLPVKATENVFLNNQNETTVRAFKECTFVSGY